MEGEQLPKATILNIIKEHIKDKKVSNEFLNGVMIISKEYLRYITADANNMCSSAGKKTISSEFIY